MGKFTRRDFLQASAIGVALAPAVVSTDIAEAYSFGKDDFRKKRPSVFKHGIASGDPLTDSVILWTRVTPHLSRKAPRLTRFLRILVGWEVATDEKFKHVIRRGRTFVTKKTDFTLKVDVKGLKAGKTYYYRFRTRGEKSPVGQTKTLPSYDVNKVKLAVMSCSNYPAGYFNVYTDAAKRNDLDAVVHLGDYIYEYGSGGYATENAAQIGRDFEPNNDTELFKLKDYRRRYAQYRTDAGLQSLHANVPWICVWDDHEVTNDTWKEGAENHNEGEGDFFKRKAKALRAYFEWMPIRPVIEGNNEIAYRQFQFGDLINLMMLDTRIVGRDEQLDYADYINSDGSFNAAQFTSDLTNPSRTLLGAEQLQWLQGALATSSAKWQVLGQQVLIGRMNLPAEILLGLGQPGADITGTIGTLAQIKARILAGDPTVTAEERARVETVLPYNLDAWDGYFVERETILGTSSALGKNLVVIAGDTHNAWANNLTDLSGNSVGVEFATSSVTSPGLEAFLQLPEQAWPATEQALQLLIDGLVYNNVGDRGYMLVTFTHDKADAEWVFIDNILSTDYNVKAGRAKSLSVKAGENKLS